MNYPEKRKREKEEEEEISSEYVVFSSQDNNDLWLKHPKLLVKYVVLQLIPEASFFFFLKNDSTKYKLFNCSLTMTMSDFYCKSDIS